MKKSLSAFTVFGFIMLLCASARGQNVYLGARLGANLANQSSNSLPNNGWNALNTGFLTGAEFDFCFNSMWSLEAQLLYDQKGTNEDYQTSSVDSNFGVPVITNGRIEINYYYLEIPVLVKYYFSKAEWQPYIFAGPSFGFFFSGNESNMSTTTGQGIVESRFGYSSVAGSGITSPDISAVAGAGISLTTHSGTILLFDAAYAFGLVNISHSGDNTSIKSRDIRLAAGILFPLNWN